MNGRPIVEDAGTPLNFRQMRQLSANYIEERTKFREHCIVLAECLRGLAASHETTHMDGFFQTMLVLVNGYATDYNISKKTTVATDFSEWRLGRKLPEFNVRAQIYAVIVKELDELALGKDIP